ncbi:MAG: hypothetical protein Q4B42_00925 [Oscillospiraceae bacterium]|nr:hypothetical protein [Oscillospiraceae bacterium]
MSEESTIVFRLKRLEERLDDSEEKNLSAHQKFYDKIEDIGKKMAVSENQYATLLSVMNEVKADVSTLKEKPNKRWESVVAAIISAAVGVLCTLALTGQIK